MVVQVVFWVAAALAIAFALLTITSRTPVISVLSLVAVFFAMATIFAILGMDFLAAVQIIVYSGAILVMFLFVVMLLNIRSVEPFGGGRPIQALLGVVSAVGLAAIVLLTVSLLAPERGTPLPGSIESGTVLPIGRALLTSHLFAFEFITLLLVAAIVGAAYLARRQER